jgi:hypothetical protein
MKRRFLEVLGIWSSLFLTGGAFAEAIVLEDFNAAAFPVNRNGALYPSQYDGANGGSAERLFISEEGEGFSGRCVVFDMRNAGDGNFADSNGYGQFYAQFNPFGPILPDDNANSVAFTHEYAKGAWTLDHYNRLTFWIKVPPNGNSLAIARGKNLDVGTFLRRSDAGRDRQETDSMHYYHYFNVPNSDTWTKVVINMHPHYKRAPGVSGNDEQGNLAHPTGEVDYNYFDLMTRFYIEADNFPGNITFPTFPVSYKVDDLQFVHESRPENDEQVYSMASTHIPGEDRLLLTWSRNKREGALRHEVRYAFSDIHEIGWDAALIPPDGDYNLDGRPDAGGVVTPTSDSEGYNRMMFTITGLPLEGRGVIYFAIKPQGSALFTQMELPLGGVPSAPRLAERPRRLRTRI